MLRALLSLAVCAGCLSAQQFLFELDPAPALPASSAAAVPVAGTRGWFRANDASNDPGLYVTDGTTAGTRRVLDSWVELVAEFSGRLLFKMPDVAQTGFGLHCTDGTIAGTFRLGPTTNELRPFGTCNGRLLLLETLPLSQQRIWSTDLTAAGTFPVATLGGSLFSTSLGSQVLVFRAPADIYATDGVTLWPVTTLPQDRYLHVQSKSAPELGGQAYFLCRRSPGGANVDELWRSDGTTTAPVTTLGPSSYRQIARAGSGLVIGGDDNSTTTIFSDGTANGTAVATSRVRAIELVTVGSTAFFSGIDATHGLELWCTDGTDAGTLLLLDATPGPADSSWSDFQAGITKGFGYCRANGVARLFVSDGTAAGTQLLAQPMPPVANSGGMAVLGDIALVRTPDQQLLATDGTTAGSVLLTDGLRRPGMGAPFHAAPLLGDLFFVADGSVHGRELWRTNGTAAGTALVEDIAPGPADAIGEMVAMRGALWFGVGGDLFRSDGTAAGRQQVASTGGGRIERLVAGRNIVSFRTPVSPFTARLWRSDGTATTACVNDLFVAATSMQIEDSTYYVSPQSHLWCWRGEASGGTDLGIVTAVLGRLGDRIVFANGTSLFSSDGTAAGTLTIGNLPLPAYQAQGNRRDGGTFLVVWDSQGICHSTDGSTVVALPIGGPSLMTGGDDLVYVQRTDAVLGPVLYATDGTVAGTRLLADWGSIHTSAAEAMYPLGTGNRILMAVRSDTGGVQPWISDGTPAGTVQLATLNPSGSSDPVLLGVAGDVSYLVADDGVVGAELWRLDLNQVGAAAVQELGVGCPGSAGEPRLRSGDTPGLGTTFEVRLSQARPNSLAAWLIGWQIGAIPVGGGCTIYMQNLGTIATTLTDAAGASSFAITIPATVSLLGASLIEQVGVFDPLGVSPFGTATSAGIYWVVGG